MIEIIDKEEMREAIPKEFTLKIYDEDNFIIMADSITRECKKESTSKNIFIILRVFIYSAKNLI